MQFVPSLRMLRVFVSQVQFSRSWSQDFGTHDRRSQLRRFQFQGPGSQGPVKVSGPRVQDLRSQGLGSQGPRVPGLRSQGLGSQGHRSQGSRSRVSDPDFRLCHEMGGNIPGGNFLGGDFPGGNFPGENFPRTGPIIDVLEELFLIINVVK